MIVFWMSLKNVKFFPLTEIYEYERTGNFGMYIPFKKPLIGSDEKRIEYKLHYMANIWEMDPITVIKNTRTRRNIEVVLQLGGIRD